jgi:uncharacterized protein (TIGR02646 family)
MRKIRKTHPPPEYRSCIEENRGNQSYCYDALPGEVKGLLKEHLLREQGCLCAYTGRQVSASESHIEHLKPQSRCDVGEDVDYRNLVACFPAEGGDVAYGYGAPVKGDWWDPARFVSPIDDSCERRFKFSWSGKIAARFADDVAVDETICRICLDHEALTDLRKKAIRGFFFDIRRGPDIGKPEARRLLQAVDLPDGDGRLRPFCFVLKHLLERIVSDH